MGNKKKKSPADDLIESLLEDVNSSDDVIELESVADDNIQYSSQEEEDPYSQDDEKIPYNEVSQIHNDYSSDNNDKLSLPDIEVSRFRGPSIEPGYQSAEEVYGSSEPAPPQVSEDSIEVEVPVEAMASDDRTVNMQSDESELDSSSSAPTTSADDKTVAAPAFAKKKATPPEEKVVIGTFKGPTKQGLVHTSVDASLAQAENLKVAQSRILELEKEVEKMRQENEDLAVASQIIRKKTEELSSQMHQLESEKNEVQDSLNEEISLLRNSLQFKENELSNAKHKVEELDARLKNDFKKIRVRERELENRLELARAEKQSLVQAKDEIILNLQRKIDQYKSELDAFKNKVSELNRTVESYQDQTKRTMRALRLAMTNMEVKDVSAEEPSPPIKKAE